MASKSPIRVAVTGAAGNIGYAAIFRLASGAVFGPDQPVALNLIEVGPGLNALAGVVMELQDCAFPLLTDVVATGDLNEGFKDADWCLLIGAVPRKDGMERKDLLGINGKIFIGQGEAIARNAKKSVKVLVVGNPCNTNALIALRSAGDLPAENFFAMTRLDENRAKSQLAGKAGAHNSVVKNVAIWGNHSSTQYPDIYHAKVDGENARDAVDDDAWIRDEFIPRVAGRGAEIIEARGASSAASAANAAIDHVRDWVLGTPSGNWTSMAIPSDGSYGVPEGIISSFPVTCADGEYSIVEGLEIDEFSRERIDASAAELMEERQAVADLGLV